MRALMAIGMAAMALFAADCTAGQGHPAASPSPLPPDQHTVSALVKIAARFNHEYDTGDRAPSAAGLVPGLRVILVIRA